MTSWAFTALAAVSTGTSRTTVSAHRQVKTAEDIATALERMRRVNRARCKLGLSLPVHRRPRRQERRGPTRSASCSQLARAWAWAGRRSPELRVVRRLAVQIEYVRIIEGQEAADLFAETTTAPASRTVTRHYDRSCRAVRQRDAPLAGSRLGRQATRLASRSMQQGASTPPGEPGHNCARLRLPVRSNPAEILASPCCVGGTWGV